MHFMDHSLLFLLEKTHCKCQPLSLLLFFFLNMKTESSNLKKYTVSYSEHYDQCHGRQNKKQSFWLQP